MNDTIITLRGNVGGDVVLRDAGETQVANFRVGATPRVLNRATGEWVDGVTQWYTVNAWRRLAHNVKRSVFKGDPVVVQGRLTVKEWADKDGVLRTSLEVEAEAVGHDLLRGTSSFVRPARTEPEPAASAAFASDQSQPSWAVPGQDLAPAVPDGLPQVGEEAEALGQDGGGDEAGLHDPIADWRAA